MVSRPPDEWLSYEKSSHITPKDHHIEEERRLFYVAVTRTKEQLYLLAPRKATSRFVKELPENIMEETVMQDVNTNKKSYSDLRIKYEQKIQKALASEQFDKVHDLANALEVIYHSEDGDDLELGSSDWEKKLVQELEQDFEPTINDKLYLSASAIETYEQCPLKYRFGRIDGIPQTASKPQLVFGNIIHFVLQRFHESGKELTKDRIVKLLEEEWKKGEFDYTVREEKFFDQGQEMLSRYAELINDNPPNVIAREERFSFDLDDITINGAIDRIDKDENGVHIVDYKTSKSSTPAKSNLQLAVYSMYLKQSDSEKFGGIPTSASLHFLRDEEKPIRSHSFTADELEKTEEKINKVAASIRRKEFEVEPGKHCDWCDYKHLICPAWEN
jgi:DNA helicase-2/ATP-dependent DNA helicase PcrA